MKKFFYKIYSVFCGEKKNNKEDIPNYESRIKESKTSDNETISNNSYGNRGISKDDQLPKTVPGWNNKDSNQVDYELKTKHKKNSDQKLNEFLFPQDKTVKHKKPKIYNDNNEEQKLPNKQKIDFNNKEDETYRIKEKNKKEAETKKFSFGKMEKLSQIKEEEKKIDLKKNQQFEINPNSSNPNQKTKKMVRHPKNDQNN